MAVSTTKNSERVRRGPVTASINFVDPPPEGEVAFQVVDPPPGIVASNWGLVTHSVLVDDIRGRESDFSLDHDAFQAIPASENKTPAELFRETEFVDDDSVVKNYYPEVEALLLSEIQGSHRVIIFDHTIRRAGPEPLRGPVMKAHIDQTDKSAAQRVVRHVPDEAEANELLKGRYRIVNVWRPLNKNPVEDTPLAFASSASFKDEHMLRSELRYASGYVGEAAAILYDEAGEQKWYYWSGMTDKERLLLECFDSEGVKEKGRKKVKGGRVPHSAFQDPRSSDDAEKRESIEVRALVFG